MEYKEINGIRLPVLGLGTWKMGGNIMADRSNDEIYIEAIKRAINSGLTHIDTAEVYSAGHSEELVGRATSEFDRKKLFITTKISPYHLFLRKQIIKSAQNSINRLKLDYIDLYLIHWPPPLFSKTIKTAMKTLNILVKEGLIKHIGVSNFSVEQTKIAQSFSESKILANQVEYHLLNKSIGNNLLNFCNENNMMLTAYSPLARGLIRNGSYKVLDDLGKKYNKTSVQVAIRYLLDKPNVITIPKITKEEHLKEILGSLNWHLKKEDMLILDRF